MTDQSRPKLENVRFDQIPIIYVRGSHYEVGYTLGRTFKNSIEDGLKKYAEYSNPAIEAHASKEGRKLYESSLKFCRNKFPGYVKELEGMSDGCGIEFYKIFLLHVDTLILPYNDGPNSTPKNENKVESRGCTSAVSFRENNIILGHNEDGPVSHLNNIFIINAEILDEQSGLTLEHFSTLSWAGTIVGGTMGYNTHGVIHSINSLVPGKTHRNKTPILFMMRALLGAKDLDEAIDILRDNGTGTSDGFNVNIVYVPKDGPPIVQNIEVGPNPEPDTLESEVDIFNIPRGESFAHCNKILRLNLREADIEPIRSSINRHEAIEKYSKPYTTSTIKSILSDQSNKEFPIYRDDLSKTVTLASGIFDVEERTWSIYTHPPATAKPIVKLRIDFDYEESNKSIGH